MNWPALRAHLRSSFETVAVEPDQVVVRLRFHNGRDDDASGVEQLVEVLVDRTRGRRWVLVRADIVEQELLDPVDALRHSAGLGVGAVVLLDGLYALHAPLPLPSLTHEDVAEVVRLVGHEAARLRQRTRAPAAAMTEPYLGYTE